MGSVVKLILLAVFTVVLVARVTDGQANTSCVQKLTPCAAYLNGTKTPPDSCCSPLKEAALTEKACLCAVYNTPGLLQSFGINSTQVTSIAKSCGVNADPATICATATSPSSSPPAATPGGKSGNGSSRMAWIGIPTTALMWASLVLVAW